MPITIYQSSEYVFKFEKLVYIYFLFIYLQAGITQNTVMHMAIFHVFPLQILGMLEINKKVSRFVCIFFLFSIVLQMLYVNLIFSDIWQWGHRCWSVSRCPCGVLQQQVSEAVQFWAHCTKGIYFLILKEFCAHC